MKKKNKRNRKLFILIPIILIIILLGYILLFKSYYKIVDRTKDIKEMKNDIKTPTPLGWLRVQGTNIDFPIMYYDDVDDVTDISYDLGWNEYEDKKLANRTVIYSHNVLNVSNKPLIGNKEHKRFEQLMSYIYYDFVKENKYIEYTIDGKNYLFKIYAVSLQNEDELVQEKLQDEDIEKYIKETKNKSFFDFDVDVRKKDKLLTLITCTRFYGDTNHSFVVDARLVRNHELARNYNVKETEQYKKVRKILEGDGQDE